MKILHFSDLHLGSGVQYGRINPATGVNTRLEDFVLTLQRCIDAALAIPVDLVLFGGDAFPDATPPPLHQEFLARQLRRLADAGIPTILLVGNHDQYGHGQEGSSLMLYRTLGVPGFVVGDTLQTHRLQTRSGPVQVTTLPWLNRSTLLAKQESMGLGTEALDQLLLQRLHLALEAEIRQLQPGIPAILLAHLMVDRARYGSERHLAVGKGFTVPLSLIARPQYQYVALGHVHRHQVLSEDPPVIYPGSPERVDFGEEQEDKGYMLVDLEATSCRYTFVPLPVRPFRTVRVDLTAIPPGSPLGQQHINQALRLTDIPGAVVRLIYRLRADQLEDIDEAALHHILSSTFSYTLHPEVISVGRTRVPDLNSHDPLQALEDYLFTRPDLAGLHRDIRLAAAELLNCRLKTEDGAEENWTEPDPESVQLTLLP